MASPAVRRPAILALLLSLLAAVLLPGCGGAKDTGRTVRIGVDATYPPFESVQDGQFTGFDVELGRALAEEMGGRAEFVNTSFDGVFPALLGGKFDLVMSAVTITDERRARLAFSEPYYTAGQVVAVREGEQQVKSIDDLDGKTAGIQINTTASLVLQKHPAVTVRQYPTIDLALQDLANGNLAAVVGDAPTLRYFIAHGFGRLSTVGALLTEEHYGIAMDPRRTDLHKEVNAALARLRANGKFAALEEKYFGKAAAAEAAQAQGAAQLPWARMARTLLRGLVLTVALTLLSLVLGLPLGLALALARLSRRGWIRAVASSYVELFRGTPLLVQIIFVYYALPQLVGLDLAPFAAAVLALTLNCAAYVAEIFRAGIGAVDAGQLEAAQALGLSRWQGMRHVVLPQAFRHALPPLTNEAIALLKDSSLVSIIGMAELTRSGQELASQLAAPLAVWPAVALFYLLVTFPLTRLAGGLERRLRIQH
ncbi:MULTISPECIES: ABC transporter permease subunit [Myxococcaceae]|uniref:ABC transporter permease subunit n=1 Tax=Myxococcaceae TaxID=31 RepID=UPI00188DE791|nr:ABC transporter permease subunit [Simulacricoccus sp. 17bor-14]